VRVSVKGILGLAFAGLIAAAAWQTGARAQAQGATPRSRAIVATTIADLQDWDAEVTRLARNGSLQSRRLDPDTLVAGRTHERYAQVYNGVPVYGGDIARQLDSSGQTISMFGTLYEGIALDTTPRLLTEQATALIAELSGVTLGPSKAPQLIVYPHDGTYSLAYRARVFKETGGTEFILDAQSGAVLARHDAARRQSAVGKGTGVLLDVKKMSVTRTGGTFQTNDVLRPPDLLTFDMRENLSRTLGFLNGDLSLGVSDLAVDSDNTWTDGPIVDAHTYSGYVYDYYFKRFGRRGLDNNNFRILSLVHPVRRQDVLAQSDEVIFTFYLNAFYAGDGVMVYGEGLPANLVLGIQHWNYVAGALDVVGHELTHGVTDFTSQLIYENESGALNEAFSDMMGTAIEFYNQDFGSGFLRADYTVGEDVVTPGGLRSLENPGLFGDPDHYSRRAILANDEDHDNGGVHVNSTIGSHAYYLAIEGGVNRTSGLSVQGVGRANREQIEKVMYRAFTLLMPANATYAVARQATIQAARDLYGVNSAAERAVTQAWTAVGVN
jgi:bacillolysin